MSLNRRDIILGAAPLAAGAVLTAGTRDAQAKTPLGAVVDITKFGLTPNASSDQTSALQKCINFAAKNKLRLELPGGDYKTASLILPSDLNFCGIGAQTRLLFIGGAAMLGAEKARNIILRDMAIIGRSKPFAGSGRRALIAMQDVSDLSIENCTISDSILNGITLRRCGGRVLNSTISKCGEAALFARDSIGLEIVQNHIEDCGNNGILVWRSKKGEDGTIVTQNRIQNIRAEAGGSGQNGNGINIFRAGSVLVTGNQIEDCTYSAVRDNGGDNVQILNNNCRRLGEVALYAEFEFQGAIISNNLVDDAHIGISITNFNDGGRLATATGNLIRNIMKREGKVGTGLGVEADTMVTGNVIENVAGIGLALGYKAFMRHVAANNNIIRNAEVGIGVTGNTKVGLAMIATNLITGSKNGAIRALDGNSPYGPDLAKESPESFPHLAIFGNIGLE